MDIYNENFFDFFGIPEEAVRSLYAQSGKLLYMVQQHHPAPKMEIPVEGIHAIGAKVRTISPKDEKWVNYILCIVIIIAIIVIGYLIWQELKPEPMVIKKDEKSNKK
jgi:hypothetical protein